MKRIASALLGVTLSAFAATAALAQDAASYPNKPIRVIVTFPPGGSADTVIRLLAPKVGDKLGQPLIIDNRPGAGGHIGMTALAQSDPDGYTIGVGAAGAMAINSSFYPDRNFKPLEQLAPITLLTQIPFVWLARADLPINNAKELVAAARAGQKLSGAHGGNGSAMHLSIELLNQLGDITIDSIAYKGSGPASVATAGGQVDVAVVDIPSALPVLDGKRAKIIAVTSERRMSNLPDVPTMIEAGIAGYSSVGWFGLVAPAKTPEPIINKLYNAFQEVMKEPEMIERALAMGVDLVSMPPAEYAKFIADETEKWARVIQVSGVKPD